MLSAWRRPTAIECHRKLHAQPNNPHTVSNPLQCPTQIPLVKHLPEPGILCRTPPSVLLEIPFPAPALLCHLFERQVALVIRAKRKTTAPCLRTTRAHNPIVRIALTRFDPSQNSQPRRQGAPQNSKAAGQNGKTGGTTAFVAGRPPSLFAYPVSFTAQPR
jgi:hypothetical protein